MSNLLDRASCFGANHYVDTRGIIDAPVSFTKAVIEGLAPGGGLFVPEAVPALTLDEITSLADLSYPQRAARIYEAFNIDLPDEQIARLMSISYGENFDTPAVCPITSLSGDIHMLELWHGPTSAFKDMALQCLPNFFGASAEALKANGELDTDFCILVATSGDTGKAALEGFKGVDGVCVGVLYPDGGVSDIQRKQMITTTGSNVCVWAMRGNFDDCQTSVKRVFADEAFASQLRNQGYALSSANSINWGRLLPQVVYYVSAYAEMVRTGSLVAGNPIDVCVPTGNFGNILAAWYARQMGTPIERLLCASNENRVLTDFINTGTYDISIREFVLTPSPSMDILVSSNLERQLFELTGRDGNAIRTWMADLNEKRTFQVDRDTFARIREVFSADSVTNAECLDAIKTVFDDQGYLMDPHTAVAYLAATHLKGTNPVLVASTAHWAKFGDNVYRALHDIAPDQPLPEEAAALTGCQLNRLIADETGKHDIPEGLAHLDTAPARFTQVIDAGERPAEEAVTAFIQTQ